jgi:hypothetical protein
MSVQLRVVDQPVYGWPWREEKWWGAMWRVPERDDDGREAWAIVLPGAAGIWTTTDRAEGQAMWDVTGIPPNLTVSPSINAIGHWHGWIRDGELVDA